uniref:BTB domain-containing protein n=1 Tax=Moniliophthora roreri TaxID=221103 RepID=A0A0W0F6L7_MONRR
MASISISDGANGATKPSENGIASPNAAASTSPTTASRNPRYYLDDSMAIFLVESQLYKVHRYFFRLESVIFDSMFDCPAPDVGQDGNTDNQPIEIPEVTCQQFEALLDHFYDGLFRKQAYFNDSTPLQKYIDLLSISHRFECTTARERAIKGIDAATTNPIQMIDLAEVYDVPKWLTPAYVELCRREEPLNESEAMDLGPRKTIIICRARETIRTSPETRRLLDYNGYYGYWSTWPQNILEESRVQRIVNECLANLPETPNPLQPAVSEATSQQSGQGWGGKKKAKGKKKAAIDHRAFLTLNCDMAEKPIDIDPHEMAKPLANSMALPVERSPSCPPPAAPAPIRHGRYYLDDSLAIFLVENHLFKVHRYFFRQESVFFDSMFDCPPPTEGQDGQTDDKPIEIPGVTCNQFEALLDHFYDGRVVLFVLMGQFLTKKYIDLLSVAHRFECTTARERAIKGIDTATTEPIQMIELAELYDVPRWIELAYIELCQRKEPLNEAEVEALGPKKTVLVLRAREALHNSDEARRLLQESWCCSSYHSPLVSLPEKLLEKARVQRIVKGVVAPPAPVAPRPSPFDKFPRGEEDR